MLYKTVHQLTAYTLPSYITVVNYTARSPYAFSIPRAAYEQYKYSFLPRTIQGWRKLPVNTLNAPSLDTFKARLAANISDGTITVQSPKTTVYTDQLWTAKLTIVH